MQGHLISAQRLTPSSPVVSATTTAAASSSSRRAIDTAKSTSWGSRGRWLLWPILADTEIFDQELRSRQHVLSIDDRHDIDEEIVNMTDRHAKNHIHVGIPDKDRKCQIRKGQVDGFHLKSPNVRRRRRIPLAPRIKNVVNHIPTKQRRQTKESQQERIRHQSPDHSQDHHEGVVGRSTTRAGIEGTAGFVLLAELHQHVDADHRVEVKCTGITEGSQDPPQFELGFYTRPAPQYLIGRYDAKVDAQRQDDGGPEPTPSDEGESFEPLVGPRRVSNATLVHWLRKRHFVDKY
mmetsp:Transcript_110533/g.165459  ORF Transcript_110533/g.165459 Transcript_110533/m.165459 type:complete len:292 (-) Transcript_110533:91-966(-)